MTFLISWWWSDRVVSVPGLSLIWFSSSLGSEAVVTLFCLSGGLSILQKSSEIHCYVYSSRRSQGVVLSWTIVSWLLLLSFHIPPLPWLTHVWIYFFDQSLAGTWGMYVRRLVLWVGTRWCRHWSSRECTKSERITILKWGSKRKGVSSVQSLSSVRLFETPWTAARQASLSITNSRSSLRLMSIELVMPSKPSHPLSSPSPPAFNLPQHQGLFQWVSSSPQVAKVLKFQHQSLRTDFL